MDALYLGLSAILIAAFPAAASMTRRIVARCLNETERVTAWIAARRRLRIAKLLSIPCWWSIITATDGNFAHPVAIPMWIVFSVPLFVGNWVGNWFIYRTDKVFLDVRWTRSDLLRLSFWSTLSATGPLIVFSIGADMLRKPSVAGLVWISVAGVIGFFARLKLRSLEGVKPRQVKSGEFYKRATAMAKRVGVRLDSVSVVPFGKGRLTNAFGGWRGVAVTDDYGHWLHGGELDFVVAHELAHVQQNHVFKKIGAAAALYLVTALLGAALPNISGVALLSYHFGVILLPLLSFYSLSRHYEFSADRLGVKFAGDAEFAISALASLYRHTGTPAACNSFEELFQTHPGLWRRIAAITKAWPVGSDSLEKVRKQFAAAVAGDSVTSTTS